MINALEGDTATVECDHDVDIEFQDSLNVEWFKDGIKTRSGSYFSEIETKTKRFFNSSIPYLTRLLNKNNVR